MKKFVLAWVICLTAVMSINAQSKEPVFTKAGDRLKSFETRRNLESASIVGGVPFTNIGPTIMSGRVVDIDVNPEDPTHFYVAYASGGVFVTMNNGQSFEPIFDHQSALTIGDIAVNWKHEEIIWVGTGESNSSRSSYSGTGIFKSEDKGKTWSHIGLEESHHIGKIILHPDHPEIAWVAAAGHLYSRNHERGIYRTEDGGKTWTQSLYINPMTGAIDMEIHPQNPDILYAAMWERERQAWNFKGSGGGSGIYRSKDGGKNWEHISRQGSGFPVGDHVGRIGLAIYPQNPDIIYAFLDNQGERPEEADKKEEILTRKALRQMSSKDFLNLPDSLIDQYLKENRFPEKYSVKEIRSKVETGMILPSALVDYVEDANSDLFNTPIIGAELWRSDDAGTTWHKTHTDYLDGLYYTYGYYFGKMNVAPDNPDKVYLYGVDIVKSADGGKTFESILAPNVHVDFHGMWINPVKPDHMIAATDGGLNMTYDDGNTWSKLNAPAVSQFYFINVDNAKPYNVYGGMQDNGVWYGPSNYKPSNAWHATGAYPYKELGGGDGMQIAIDTVNNYTYYGYQFGHYFRKDMKSNKVDYITPRHELGERPHRWNWQTPVMISRHNPSIVYMGSNHFHRSMDHGSSFPLKSKDLTAGGKKGNVPYGTLTTIDESPLRFGLICTGSDDGLVYLSYDAGQTWTNISKGLPAGLWVSRVVVSAHKESRIYVTLNGYRYDHFNAYVFLSEDYGTTWTNISANLPLESVNVVVEDPVLEDVLYVGTDNGLYISFDRGKSYMLLNNSLPNVAVHDLKIQKRDKDLVVGTHGRSIYKTSIREIQQLTPEIRNRDLVILPPDQVIYNPNWGRKREVWSESPESVRMIPVWVLNPGNLELQVSAGDNVLQKIEYKAALAGLQFIPYDLCIEETQVDGYNQWLSEQPSKDDKPAQVKAADNGKYYLLPGEYALTLKDHANNEASGKLKVSEGRRGFRWGIRPSQREERKIKEFHWE